MDIQTFQNKLNEVRQLAAGNGNVLTARQVKTFFAELKPDKEQLIQILKYLKMQGIVIEGLETEAGADSPAEAVTQKELTQEEEMYLSEYCASLGNVEFNAQAVEKWFQEFAVGSPDAKAKLVEMYLGVAADIARSMYCDGVHLQDLIQEANVSLLTAFQVKEPVRKTDEWLRKEIRSGLKLAIEEQTQQKFEDDYLVEKVQKLEQTVKELTDDEDGEAGSKFSVEDLAILLDMNVEEIEDVLRLTGGL
ncbi:MAG: sigma factor [Eubacteriales bacterium]|nr:sigma factor [Eubacteriales bacterium]